MTASPSPAKAIKPRPLSPHLQVYKPQLTTFMSILHRATGMALSGGLLVMIWWLVALTLGSQAYGQFLHCAGSWPGQLVLLGFSFSFFYHFCTGIRHLLWDAGWFLDIEDVYATGYIAGAAGLLLTALLWLHVYGVLP